MIKNLAQELTKNYGKGFSERNLKNFRKYYVTYSHIRIGQTMSAQSHKQLKIEIKEAFYIHR